MKVDDFAFPTTTTTTTTAPAPPPPPTEKPQEPEAELPAAEDRFVVAVKGHGSFVVVRKGDHLRVESVDAVAGHDHEVVGAEGEKVIVRFTDGAWNWYGKALINHAGEVEQHFWDEAVPFDPVYQWVDVPSAGAVKFKLWSDGLVYVKEWDTASGWSFHDHNAGAPAAVARVEFEAAGASWVVEAWKNAEKTLSWSVTPGAARSAA